MSDKSPLPPSNPLQLAMNTEDEAQWCATRLKALADPDRLRLVSCLFRGPKNVSELAAELGEEMVNVSHHLGVLRHAGVVETEKRGRFVVYRLDPKIVPPDANPELAVIDLGCCRLDLSKKAE